MTDIFRHLLKELPLSIWACCNVYSEIGDKKGPRESVTAFGAQRRVHRRIRVPTECNARYIMLKSYYDMNYLVLILDEAEICKRSSKAGDGESS